MKKLPKILPLVALVLASLVMFSGCGKILEVFYPDATGTGGQTNGDNGVSLHVNISTTVPNWGSTIFVRLESSDPAFSPRQVSGYAYDGGAGTATWVVSFDYLPAADYRIFAWLDLDGNGTCDPATEAAGGRDWFHLPYKHWDQKTKKQVTQKYPDFPVDLAAPAGDMNAVKLNVYLDKASIAGWASLNVAAELVQTEGQWFPDPIRHVVAVESADDVTKALAAFAYKNLPSGTYKMSAWLDRNNDSIKDTDEEIVAVSTDHGEVFPVPYYNPWDTAKTPFVPEFRVDIYGAGTVDPGFGLYGPASIDKAAPGAATIWMYPVDAGNDLTTATVQFKITDEGYNPLPVAPWSDWQTVASVSYESTGGGYYFSIDFSAMSPGLGDTWWTGKTSLIVQVMGGPYSTELLIPLTDSSGGGSYYNLYVNTAFSDTAPFGYAYVYVVDSTDYTTLAYDSRYLDADGYYPFSFSGIFDPSGRDQEIEVSLYDSYGYYVGYYVYLLDGNHSGSYSYEVADWGVWTAD